MLNRRAVSAASATLTITPAKLVPAQAGNGVQEAAGCPLLRE